MSRTVSKVAAKKHGIYNKPNEIFRKFCFKTEFRLWSKIIEFPVVDIPSPGNNPILLRDTFRTFATVRIVYLKVRSH